MKTSVKPGLSRRRLIQLVAGVAGAGAVSAFAAGAEFSAGMQSASWRGIALGAEASMTLLHKDGSKAKRALEAAVAELRRLEAIFSIYDPASAVSMLNREGSLVAPPMELVSLLSIARTISEATSGYFDVSVQPLWAAASEQEACEHVSLVDQWRIEFDTKMIKLGSGQAVTFNGIAQGAITDALGALLRRAGFSDLLLDTGEIVASGMSPNLDPWQVQLGDEEGPTVALRDRAVATSKPSSPKAHLFDPLSGRRGALYKSVSVVAKRATLADGLSTALAVMPEPVWQHTLANFDGENIRVFATRVDGSSFEHTAKKPA